ncbi:MAG: CinA family protein [Gammaproteobacteria bacterium]|nr:CinA family protein [Gammaproteobacteria bacterium]
MLLNFEQSDITQTRCETLLRQIAAQLTEQQTMLATAESCTGGGIAYAITAMPGSSAWFERGFVTYSNLAKQQQLGVARDLLVRFGAVSEEVAAAMARGALEHSQADFSVAVTGIAGPDGGAEEKPVGTVCFGWAQRDTEARTACIKFNGDRQQVRELSILTALQGVAELAQQPASPPGHQHKTGF